MYTLYGHRGNEKDYIENTKDSIINCKYEGIEVDVHLTSDNKIILHHDPTFKRIYNFPHKIKNLELDYIKKNFDSILELKELLIICNTNNKKLIIDIKEKTYEEIIFIIEMSLLYSKEIKYDKKNIIFLCWENIIKPFKNITYLKVIGNDYISNKNIDIFKNELLFDGICLNYSASLRNIDCINYIKSKNMLVNIYTNKDIELINLSRIKPDFITL
tara:strand:- start:469 stop:1116 length:648 start_codon:yes stop_codon:yes gene_type:complete